MAKRDIYQEITDKIVSLMESEGANWVKPWAASVASDWPVNAVTGNPYNGTNVVLLALAASARGYRTNQWASYKQWQGKGAQVRKGERGTMGIFFKKIPITETRDDGKEEEKQIPLIRAFTLFNADQVDGYEIPAKPDPEPLNVHDDAETWIANSGATVQHGGNVACYIPSADVIKMPERSAFKSEPCYYSTALHELAHWTGHASRLDRLGKGNRFGSEEYALEELIAELSAAFQCAMLGVTVEPRPDHAKYLNNWLKALRDDNKAFTRAVSKAQQATDYLAELQREEVAA